jgi:hypothetical protein
MSLCVLDRAYKSRGWQAEDIKQPPQLIQQTSNQPTPLNMKFVIFFVLLIGVHSSFKFHFSQTLILLACVACCMAAPDGARVIPVVERTEVRDLQGQFTLE